MKRNFSLLLAIIVAVLLNIFLYSVVVGLIKQEDNVKMLCGLGLAVLLIAGDIVFIRKIGTRKGDPPPGNRTKV